MLKAIERMHSRSKFVRVGMSCMGQQLVGAYRLMHDEESGISFCMMMTWAGSGDKIRFANHSTDEYLHLFFEDLPRDWKREENLKENGPMNLDASIIESKEYQRVYQQLFKAICKSMSTIGYTVNEDLTVTAN